MNYINVLNVLVSLSFIISALADDYYQLLNVSRDADTKGIKRAYRKLAIKYHPDKNKEKGAKEKFLEITKAYEILSDPNKRQKYDKYGESAFTEDGSGADSNSFNMNDFFKDFDFFQTHHSDDDFGQGFHGGNNNGFFRNLFDDDDDGQMHHGNQHFGSFDSFFGDYSEGNTHQVYEERTMHSSGGQRCRTITRQEGNTVMTQTICN